MGYVLDFDLTGWTPVMQTSRGIEFRVSSNRYDVGSDRAAFICFAENEETKNISLLFFKPSDTYTRHSFPSIYPTVTKDWFDFKNKRYVLKTELYARYQIGDDPVFFYEELSEEHITFKRYDWIHMNGKNKYPQHEYRGKYFEHASPIDFGKTNEYFSTYDDSSALRYTFTVYELPRNSAPELNITSNTDLPLINNNDNILVEGSTLEIDSGDSVTVQYQVNDSPVQNLNAYVSDGMTAVPFKKELTYKDKAIYDGEKKIVDDVDHTKEHAIKIWAIDSQKNRSKIEIIKFNIRENSPPVLKLIDIPSINNATLNEVLKVTGKASDPDEDAELTITAQMNNEEPQAIPIDDGEWSFSFAVKQLNEGDNILTFEVADQYGATDKKKVKLTNTVHASPAPISVARYKLDTPEPITDLIMWIKHKADADIKAYASIVQEGEPDNYVEMTKVEGTSPTGVLESEFTYSTEVAGANAKVKIVNANQAMMIMGGMSNNAES